MSIEQTIQEANETVRNREEECEPAGDGDTDGEISRDVKDGDSETTYRWVSRGLIDRSDTKTNRLRLVECPACEESLWEKDVAHHINNHRPEHFLRPLKEPAVTVRGGESDA